MNILFENLEEPVRKAILLFQLSVAIFGISFIFLWYFTSLDTTVQIMSIVGNIFLASGALASAYLASKSLAHKKSVEIHGVVVEENGEVGIKVFNTGKTPILVTEAPIVRINQNKRNYTCHYIDLDSAPVLIEPEESETLNSTSGSVVAPVGYIQYRDFENASDFLSSEHIELEKSYPRFFVDGLSKEKLERVWETIKNDVLGDPSIELRHDTMMLFSTQEDLVEMDDRKLNETVMDTIDFDEIAL